MGEPVEVDPDPAIRVRAVELALRYGLGTDNKVDDDPKPVLLIDV